MPSPSAFLASSREPRIAPLDAPYPEEIERMLAKWMGPIRDRDPLRLFRTLSIHGELASRMGVLGAGLLGNPRVTPREREIVIQRINTARGGAECEWGVHTKVFGENVELNEAQLAATAHGASDDPAWSERDRLLIRLADEIHEAADLSDSLWSKLTEHWLKEELIELVVTAGWYRVISALVNTIRPELERWAARFPVRPASQSE
jgi:4-carboxymuconolactone decarboxylase